MKTSGATLAACVTCASLLLAPARGEAQGLVAVVRMQETDAPVEGAEVFAVSAAGDSTGARTDSLGRAVIRLGAQGRYTMRVRYIGLQLAEPLTVEVTGKKAMRVDLPLVRAGIALDPIDVVGEAAVARRLATFDDHRKTGSGFYLDSAEIMLHRPDMVTDVLRHVPGVRVIGGPGNWIARFGGGVNALRDRCPPALYVNGGRVSDPDLNLNAMVAPRDIAGIEVYRNMLEAPPEYADSRARCGLIMIWTRGPGSE